MAAPGEALITLFPLNGYAGVWGTSFSADLVSGAATLMMQVDPKATSWSVMSAFSHWYPIQAGMGNSRLDMLPSLLFIASPNAASEDSGGDK